MKCELYFNEAFKNIYHYHVLSAYEAPKWGKDSGMTVLIGRGQGKW